MSAVPKALIAVFADPSASPRARRMTQLCLKHGYETHLLSLAQKRDLGLHKLYPLSKSTSKWNTTRKIAAIKIGLLFPFVRSKTYLESIIEKAYGLNQIEDPFAENKYHVIIIEDLYLLPYCLKRRNNTPILFDAREFYPKQRERNIVFELLEKPIRNWTCKTFMKHCDTVFTVSKGIASAYENEYNINAKVLRSTPPYISKSINRQPPPTNKIRLVHLGVANPNRKIENMIQIFEGVKDLFSIDFYLAGNSRYIKKLRRISKDISGLKILNPVAPKDIISTLSHYDIGFYYLEPHGFNLKHSLPNKFFEFIQARLAVAVGPSPEMAKIVNEYNCGFVAENFTTSSMIKTLRAITSETLKNAQQASERAANILCAENEWKQVEDVLAKLKNS